MSVSTLRFVCLAACLLAAWVVARGAPAYTFSIYSGASSPGSADVWPGPARFYSPSAVAVDGYGTLYVSDGLNHTVRRISPAGIVTTFAGTAGLTGSADGQGG